MHKPTSLGICLWVVILMVASCSTENKAISDSEIISLFISSINNTSSTNNLVTSVDDAEFFALNFENGQQILLHKIWFHIKNIT